MNKVISEFAKNSGETVRVSLTEFKGRELIDCRVHYRDDKTGELRPTKKGITISVDLYDDLRKAILATGEVLARRA